ncbi:hypothetical protein E5D08_28410 [Klebsiella pneumoniae]|uniref:hypothetical protein n=1 Tax=Klebsiella TaxID=570 RepID=UPI0015EEED29|nr:MULTISPECIES: hypothetical protein [Klebsiella]EJA9211349.1 hypothetical protein [Escherichia coli]HBY1220042.1 hypothetical protein [Klebsiella aerogenes]EIW9594141.1 hypothetical protein [Klebsiella pneumoniae]MCT8891422.1 hypothetical protein [Klebsiella quasipneumoniae subsp. similipneumoniae]MDP0618011.1 hypothetical protein [Klebsiella pneumoniae]
MSKQMPSILGDQPVSLLMDFLDITVRLQNTLDGLQKKQGDDVKIGDIWDRLSDREQCDLLTAIKKFTGKQIDDNDDIWGVDDLNN